MEQAVQKTKGFRALPVYKENPFLEATVITTKQKRTTLIAGAPLVDGKTGEVTRNEIRQIVQVDDGQFIKFFTKEAQVFFDLSGTALKALVVVMVTVQQHMGTDRLWLKYDEDSELFTFSKQTFYKGLAELAERKVIAKTTDAHWYFLNPNIFFNGDRATFVREYRRVQQANKVKSLVDDKQLTFAAI